MRNPAIGNTYNIDPYSLRPEAVFDGNRFGTPDLRLDLSPSFELLPSDRVFVIGSCFAREIHNAMVERGFTAAGAELGNKYNTFSILQALRWAVNGGYGEELLVQLRDGTWFDGHRHPFVHQQSAEAAIEAQRSALSKAARGLQECATVVMTIGIVEVWHDDRENVWLNGTPPADLIANFDQRFSLKRTTQAQNLETLLEIFRLLRSINPGVEIVCSVSPIPMYATFSGEDVLVANMYSKSTLRSALTEAIQRAREEFEEPIHYFPGYELVMLNPNRSDVWRDLHPTGALDGRHVRADFVADMIARLFGEREPVGASD